MSVHRYPASTTVADLARAGLGGALAVAPLAMATLTPWLSATLFAILALFLAYAVQTLVRAAAHIEADDNGVRLTGGWRQTAIRWNGLSLFRLTYHSTRRDRQAGWMTLTLAGDGRLAIDSRIQGFTRIVHLAAIAAASRRLTLDPATLGNLHALGLNLPEAMPVPKA